MGNGEALALTPSQEVLVDESIGLDTLSTGSHTIYTRAIDENGNWSFPQNQSFYHEPENAFVNPDLEKIEYYVDTDPGLGQGDTIPFAISNDITVDTTIDLNEFDVGSHTLFVRAQDEAGRWSFPQKQAFFFDDVRIEYAEFKFDSIPAYADWVESNPFTPDTSIVADIDFEGICDLDTGWYYIEARVRRELSWWSEVKVDSIEIKDFYGFSGQLLDQFDNPISGAVMHFAGADTISTTVSGGYDVLVPKCWGDTISAYKDSLYTSAESYYFANPLIDLRHKHVLGDIDTTLYGYKCQNLAGTTSEDIAYVCEDVTLMMSKAGEYVDTGSLSGYILHDGMNTLGTVFEMNLNGEFTNSGIYPRNQKLYISSVVGRPDGELPDINHECTDIEFPGRPVVFLDIIDTTVLYLDSLGQAAMVPADLLIDGCATCEIDTTFMSQFEFDCTDHGTNGESVTVDDGSGNSATCDVTVIVFDTISPIVTCRADTLVHTDPGVCSFTPFAGLFDPTSTWDNCPTTLSNDFAAGMSLNGKPFDLGDHTVTWTIDDGHGNLDSCSFSVTVEDHEVPQISCPSSDTLYTDGGQCTRTIVAGELDPLSVTDNCTAFTFDNDSNFTSSLDGEILELGSHVFTWSVDDQHGQTASCSFTMVVEDDEHPVITCPANASRNTDPGQCTYTINGGEFDPLIVSDNCTDFTYSNNADATTSVDAIVLGLGDSTFVWTVDDMHGNVSVCSLTVTVEDNEVPEISCQDSMVRFTGADLCDYAVDGMEFTPISVSDNCMELTFSNNLNATDSTAGEILPRGVTEITWTVDDGHGQSASCTQVITVIDSQPPQITCPPDITMQIGPGACDTMYNYSILTSDNCPSESLSLNGGIGSDAPFPIGMTSEQYVVTDVEGNTSGCSFNITVEQLTFDPQDTICFGDSVFLAGMWQYLPGLYIDTFTNVNGCDSVVRTTLDTTTICIWPSEIVYVDSGRTSGENTGVDWVNAYLDLQLALDVSRRYQNITQIWIAQGTYFPTAGSNRFAQFDIPSNIWIGGGFEGVEIDSSQKEHSLYPVYLSGNIGAPLDSLDNSYHVLSADKTVENAILDGLIVIDGVANPESGTSRSGAGLYNRGQVKLIDCSFVNCASTNFGSAIYNQQTKANLTIINCNFINSSNGAINNRANAKLRMIGNTLVDD